MEKVLSENSLELAKELLSVAPDFTRLYFENDYVKVVKVSLPPGSELPFHTTFDRAIYSLSDYSIKWMAKNERRFENWKKGDAHWHYKSHHDIINIGDSLAEYLIILRKPLALPSFNPFDIEYDECIDSLPYVTVKFENDHLKITEITLAPGQETKMHNGINRLVYSLNNYKILYIQEDGSEMMEDMQEGNILWHDPDMHAFRNIGVSEAKFTMFSFKE
ncbi:hypothetical protein AAG747_19935 [Rapidithrix thailandica]|uniref:Uncharacterized protein n=1 Tax=Rapidithrix thailandica TaxID=413964 RepID=A0AAW9SB58_9BACT